MHRITVTTTTDAKAQAQATQPTVATSAKKSKQPQAWHSKFAPPMQAALGVPVVPELERGAAVSAAWQTSVAYSCTPLMRGASTDPGVRCSRSSSRPRSSACTATTSS